LSKKIINTIIDLATKKAPIGVTLNYMVRMNKQWCETHTI